MWVENVCMGIELIWTYFISLITKALLIQKKNSSTILKFFSI